MVNSYIFAYEFSVSGMYLNNGCISPTFFLEHHAHACKEILGTVVIGPAEPFTEHGCAACSSGAGLIHRARSQTSGTGLSWGTMIKESKFDGKIDPRGVASVMVPLGLGLDLHPKGFQ